MSDKKPRIRLASTVRLPSVTFEEAIKIITEATRLGGTSASMDALATASGNSPTSSTFNHKIYSLRTFGLLQNAEKGNYVMTDLAVNIVQPVSDEQKILSIQEAFTKHETVKTVWENYRGKILPQAEYLANWMEKNANIPADIKQQWAEYFIDGVKFAGLTIQRGDSGNYQLLSSFGTLGKKQEDTKKDIKEDTTGKGKDGGDEGRGGKGQESRTNIVEQLFSGLTGGLSLTKKISGDRKALIFIPEELTEADISSITAILDSAKSALLGLKSDEN